MAPYWSNPGVSKIGNYWSVLIWYGISLIQQLPCLSIIGPVDVPEIRSTPSHLQTDTNATYIAIDTLNTYFSFSIIFCFHWRISNSRSSCCWTLETPHWEKMVKDSGNVRVRWVKQAKSVLLVVCFMPPLCPIIQRWDLFFANLVTQDPGKARQNS